MPFHVPEPIFVFGINGGAKVFIPEGVRDGKEATRWVLTDACVVLVTCSHCGAKPGEFCQFDSGKRGVSTHWARRSAAGKIGSWKRSDLMKRLPSVRFGSTLQDLDKSDDLGVEEHW